MEANDSNKIDLGNIDQLQNFNKILSSFILLAMITKYMHILKWNSKVGIQSELITNVIKEIYSFMIIFLMWNSFFAEIFYIFESNKGEVEGYKGAPTALGCALS